MWFGKLCNCRLFNEVVEDLLKAVVDIKRSFVGHLGIDQALIQGHGDPVCLLAQRRGHAPDLVPVEVDGGDLGSVTPIRNLVALTIEAESGSAAGDGLFAVAERGHMPENFGQFLTLPVQADLAVHIQIQSALGRMNGFAQILPLLHQKHDEGRHLVGVPGILAGRSLLHHGIQGFRHDLTAQMGGFDFDNVAPVLQDAGGLTHQVFEFVLKTECIFHVHSAYLLERHQTTIISSGVFCGLLDSLFVGEFSLNEAGRWGNKKVERFVMHVAKSQGYGGDTLAGAVKYLEDTFPIPADKATAQFGGGLQHHLRDFSHHPTPVGLVCSILTQFTGKVYGTDVSGAFHGVNLSDDGLALIGRSVPEKIMFGVLNWAFHLVSDMAGSSGSILKGSLGTGLPGPLVSLLKELSSTPLFQKSDGSGYRVCSVWISKLFNGTLLGQRDTNGKLIPIKFDLRMELGVARQVGRQTLPVLLNECVVRGFYLLRQLTSELICTGNVQGPDKLNWRKIAPFQNRTIDRMLTISTMTFTMADTMDAAVHAAILSAGSWVLFSGKFVTRFNYVGAGRSALAIVREVSNEKKETQLIHEKMLLSEAKTAIFLAQLQEFKVQLEEKVSNYLAEELETFVAGFDFINTGIASGNSDMVIQGNMKIQSVLGRQPQFTNQQEFDSLMKSDTPLVL